MDRYVIGIVSQKGGVGKSTITRAVAREGAANDLNVKVADLDVQQGTVAEWHRRRLQLEIRPTFEVQQFSTAADALSKCTNVDLLLIDGPARASSGTYDIAKASDLVVQPTGASLDDLEPAVKLFHELFKKGVDRRKLVFALSRVGTGPEERECRRYLAESGYDVLDGCIYEKPSYRQAMNSGYVITETKYNKLNQRAELLIQSLIDKITEQSAALEEAS
jgi:chromosome partitioning protein